jgi:hypothetical protein
VWKELGEFFRSVKVRSVEVPIETKDASKVEQESHA